MRGWREVAGPAMAMLLMALAGCLGDGVGPAGRDADQGDGQSDDGGREPDADNGGGELAASPLGCDGSRPVWVHGPGGPVTPSLEAGTPCLHVAAWEGFEPSLGLTSDGSLFLFPAYEPLTDPGTQHTTPSGAARSLDGGATFERLESNVGPVSHHPWDYDPFLYVDPYTDRVFMENLVAPPFNCANLSYSDDRGETWKQTVAGCLVFDHVGYGSGPPMVSQTRDGYPTVLQRCGISLGATTLASEATGCQKSLDGGARWEPPGEPAFLFGPDGLPHPPAACHGAAHHPFVDHRGWTWLGRVWCDRHPYLALSKDEGATWTRSRVSDTLAAGHDVGVGVDPAGRVYATWIAADDQLPYLARSDDDGRTWTEPMRITPDGVTAVGDLSIAPGGRGKAALAYVASLADDPGALHAVVVAATQLDSAAPRFATAVLTTAEAPMVAAGTCDNGDCVRHGDLSDATIEFLDATIGPDGTPWGSFLREDRLAGGRIWGAASLWDPEDPDGVYGGWVAGVASPAIAP